MDEMILNGLAPDRVFLELSIMHCMRSSRIGDCFYYYNEMKRRGMAPSSKLQGLLISVLSREGHLHAAEEVMLHMRASRPIGKLTSVQIVSNSFLILSRLK